MKYLDRWKSKVWSQSVENLKNRMFYFLRINICLLRLPCYWVAVKFGQTSELDPVQIKVMYMYIFSYWFLRHTWIYILIHPFLHFSRTPGSRKGIHQTYFFFWTKVCFWIILLDAPNSLHFLSFSNTMLYICK